MTKWYSNGLTDEIIQKEELKKRTAVIDNIPSLELYRDGLALNFRARYNDDGKIRTHFLTDLKEVEHLMRATKSFEITQLKNKDVEIYVNPKDLINFFRGISIDSELYKSSELGFIWGIVSG
jgi:hypothetical protein